jgi:hypothetical protein
MHWGDGFEIETLINCRVAVAQLAVAEVPSIEQLRLFGDSNLDAMKDGLRVLKTLMTEWSRARVIRRKGRVPMANSDQRYEPQAVAEILPVAAGTKSSETMSAGRASTNENPGTISDRLLDQTA